MYMFTLSEQTWMDAGSSITGIPANEAIREATYVTFIGSVRARMKRASTCGIFRMSTGKMKSTECPISSAASRHRIRAVSWSEEESVFRSTNIPRRLIGRPARGCMP